MKRDIAWRCPSSPKHFVALTEIRDLTEYEFDLIPYEDANALLKEKVKEKGILLRMEVLDR